MDVQLEKYKLVEWLVNLNDERIISKIKSLKESFTSSEWNSTISEEEKKSILLGLKDIDEDNVSSHEDVMRRIEQRFGI